MKTIKVTSHGVVDLSKYRVSSWAQDVLKQVKYTNGITYEIAIIKGEEFKDYSNRTTEKIRAEALKRGYTTPPAEIGPLLREALTDEEIEKMGLWYVVAMHEPIKDSDGDLRLLYVIRYDAGPWLNTYYDDPGEPLGADGGFAFVVSQVGAESSDTQTSSVPLNLDLEWAINLCKENGLQVSKIY